MKEAKKGLVRYRGRLMTPKMAILLKAGIPHTKARKYAPKGVDPSDVSPTLDDINRLGIGVLTTEARARLKRMITMVRPLLQDSPVQAES